MRLHDELEVRLAVKVPERADGLCCPVDEGMTLIRAARSMRVPSSYSSYAYYETFKATRALILSEGGSDLGMIQPAFPSLLPIQQALEVGSNLLRVQVEVLRDRVTLLGASVDPQLPPEASVGCRSPMNSRLLRQEFDAMEVSGPSV